MVRIVLEAIVVVLICINSSWKSFAMATKYLFFAAVLFCLASSYCRAQDPVQIVAQSALCFNNRTVVNECLLSMGINISATLNSSSVQHTTPPSIHHNNSSPVVAKNSSNTNSTAAFCDSPCYENMKLVMECVNGIMSNFQGYNSGVMDGMKSIFDMSCRIGKNNNSSATTPTSAADPNAATGAKKMANETGSKTRAMSAGIVLVIPKHRWIAMLLTTTTMLLRHY